MKSDQDQKKSSNFQQSLDLLKSTDSLLRSGAPPTQVHRKGLVNTYPYVRQPKNQRRRRKLKEMPSLNKILSSNNKNFCCPFH